MSKNKNRYPLEDYIKNNYSTDETDRPWPVGSIWVLDDGDSVDLVRVIAYLEEEDPIAETRVVFENHDDEFPNGNLPYFTDTVSRLVNNNWMSKPVFIHALKR